ncbi:UNVERIFIED_ORG: MFS transporter [Bacillus sp. AZ43]
MPSALAPVPAQLRSARLAVTACFFLNAVFFANLVPRLPDIKADLGLSNAALGAALAAMPLGALLAALGSAPLIRRFTSARVATWGLVLLGIALFGVSVAPSWAALAGALLVAGALDAVIDVAQNAHGLRVQRLYRRSILNAFHAFWSIGAVCGGLIGSVAAGLEVPRAVHLGVVTVVFGLVAAIAYRGMLPGDDHADREPEPERPPGAPRAGRRAAWIAMAALGVLGVCGAVVEDAGASWAALYLRTELGTGAALAGLGFVALQGAMTIGRLTGDRVVDRFGQRRVAQAGGVLIAVGMGSALAVPSVPSTLAGFALAGLGVATLIPAVYHAADELPGLRHGTGLAVINWLLRIGFLLSPPVIGLVADATSLRAALVAVVLAGLVTLLLGRVLRPSAAS